MASPDETAPSRAAADLDEPDYSARRSIFKRYARRRLPYLAGLMALGFVLGVAYRYHYDLTPERSLANYLRSGVHGVGIAVTLWLVQAGFAATGRSSFGAALRRLPIAGEAVVRALVMALALVIAIIALQAVLYVEPLGAHWLTERWFTSTLPRVVLFGIAISVVFGLVTETRRLVGGTILTSVVLGTYHRPTRERRIVMFLDIAGSTRLAEEMGELRVHDLITRFFFDIDEPISDHGGEVHAYVGDEVIVTWPVADDPARNARCLACFFAIERKIAALAAEYDREFHVVPRFRGGLHVGPVIVAECGDAKRQLAYFGDTMNVAARLCEYCKAIDRRLVVSEDLLRQLTIPPGLRADDGERVVLRGRQEPIEAHAVERSVVFVPSR